MPDELYDIKKSKSKLKNECSIDISVFAWGRGILQLQRAGFGDSKNIHEGSVRAAWAISQSHSPSWTSSLGPFGGTSGQATWTHARGKGQLRLLKAWPGNSDDRFRIGLTLLKKAHSTWAGRRNTGRGYRLVKIASLWLISHRQWGFNQQKQETHRISHIVGCILQRPTWRLLVVMGFPAKHVFDSEGGACAM